VKNLWNKGSDAADKLSGKRPPYEADPDDVEKANESFKPQPVGKKTVAKPSSAIAKPSTVGSKAAPRKKL